METVTKWMQTLFGGVWDLFNSVIVPGFNISLARVLIGFFVIKWSLNILALVTGFHTNATTASEQMRTSHETLGQYKKVKEQNERRSGSMGFHP